MIYFYLAFVLFSLVPCFASPEEFIEDLRSDYGLHTVYLLPEIGGGAGDPFEGSRRLREKRLISLDQKEIEILVRFLGNPIDTDILDITCRMRLVALSGTVPTPEGGFRNLECDLTDDRFIIRLRSKEGAITHDLRYEGEIVNWLNELAADFY